jgi:uncharacterized repeat protein (TIGR01451 family)
VWIAVVLVALVGANVARADRVFTPRFATNDTGAITMAANTVLTCPASDAKCAPAQTGGSASNNTFRMGYVDVDADAATFDSSRATLRLPSGATVLYAGLYWGANTAAGSGGAAARDPAARGRVLLATPGSAGYRPVAAATVDRGAATSQKDAYQGFADVTSLVRAAGAGDYTVADVQSGTGEDRYAGWALVVAYRDRTAPARNLTLFDGFISINSGDAPREVVVEGFKAPHSGPVHASLGEVAYEGDRSLGGDSAAFDATALSDDRNPSTNSFNSTIAHRGAPETGRTPAYDNQLGFDADVFDASGIVRNGATSAALKFQTGGDTYLPGVVFVAIDIYAPDVVVEKSVRDVNGGQVEPGDELEYTIVGRNHGQDAALGLELTDPLPSATTLVPGSLEELRSGVAHGRTEAADADQGEFDAPAEQVVMRLGHGAGAIAGGRLAPGETFTVRFRVRVRDGTPSGTAIDDAARANFVAETLGFALEAQTNVTHLVTVAPDLAIAKRHDGTLAPGTAGTYVIAVRNAGDGPTHGEVRVHDALPAGVTATSAAGAGWACAVVVGAVDCTRADALAPGAAYPDIAVPVDVAFDAAPPLENVATVAGGGENDPANDEAIDSANPEPAADLAVAKTAEPDEPRPGQDVTYVVQVANDGPAAATAVVVDDPTPVGLTVRTADAEQGSCDMSVRCTLGTLTPGQLVRVTIRATVAADAPAGPIANAATVAGGLRDPNPGNDGATAGVSVRATADVKLDKRLLGTAHAGRPVAWVITAINHGPHRADGLVVVDPLPHAVEDPVVTVAVGGGHCAVADRVARCTLHALAPGERAEVRVSGRLGPHAGGTFLDNGAELFEHEQDPAPRAAAHSDQVVVEPAADVEITADATPMVPVPGDLLTYHVSVEDRGPGTARGVRFAERLPSAVAPITVPSGCTIAAKVVRCDVGPLSPGAALGFDIVVRVAPDAARQLLHAHLSVGGAQPDPASADNRDVARTSVGRAPPQPHFTG